MTSLFAVLFVAIYGFLCTCVISYIIELTMGHCLGRSYGTSAWLFQPTHGSTASKQVEDRTFSNEAALIAFIREQAGAPPPLPPLPPVDDTPPGLPPPAWRFVRENDGVDSYPVVFSGAGSVESDFDDDFNDSRDRGVSEYGDVEAHNPQSGEEDVMEEVYRSENESNRTFNPWMARARE